MESAYLIEGRFYGYRENPRRTDSPLLKVKLVAKVGRRGHVKVRYEDGPHPGLEEYVKTRQIVVPWSDRRVFLRDEEQFERLHEHAKGVRGGAIVDAIRRILESSGEPSAGAEVGGLSMPLDEVENITMRAGLEGPPEKLHPLGFVDRQGDVHLPLEGAERLARAFAAAEPQTVLMYIEDFEEQYRAKGYAQGERYYHDLLRQYQPGFALARQWAGFEREVEELQKEIGRLRGLVSMAARNTRRDLTRYL